MSSPLSPPHRPSLVVDRTSALWQRGPSPSSGSNALTPQGSPVAGSMQVRKAAPSSSSVDNHLMDIAIQYGHSGIATAYPLPWTGCVIVSSDMRVLGRGFTRSALSKHAVEIALQEARSLNSDDEMHAATCYITVEPAYGPNIASPEASILQSNGLSRVVFAMENPNPAFTGACIAALRQAGVLVEVGLQEAQARASLYPFLFATKHRVPLVKMAVSTEAPIAAEINIATAGAVGSPSSKHKRGVSLGGVREDLARVLPDMVRRFRHHCQAAGAIVLDARKAASPMILQALVQTMALQQPGTAGRGEMALPPWIVVLDPETEMVFSDLVRVAAAQGSVRLAWAAGEHELAAQQHPDSEQQAEAETGNRRIVILKSPFVGLELLPLPTAKSLSSSVKAGRMIPWPAVGKVVQERLQVAQLWVDDLLVTGRLIDELRKQGSVDASIRWTVADQPSSDSQQVLSSRLNAILHGDRRRGQSDDISNTPNLRPEPSGLDLDGLVATTYGSLPTYHNGALTVNTIIPGQAPTTSPHLAENKPIFFRTGDDHFGYLSNFSADPVEVEGKLYATVEHYYQAMKFVNHPEIQEEIRLASGPLEAKNLSRKYERSVRKDWEECKVDVMDKALRLKFTNAKLLGALLATKDRLLVEYSDLDNFWGSDYSLLGRNYLGRLLMRLRGEYNGVVATAHLPCAFGEGFRIVAFAWSQHVAVVYGDLDLTKPVLIRLHSECVTGDVFGSQRCDCGPQLHSAMKLLRDSGAGVLLYLRQEGRGIGISNKVRAYKLQECGFDTIEANEILGFPADMRDFSEAAAMLRVLGVKEVRLITNNPDKREHLKQYGIPVVDTVTLPSPVHPGNEAYLLTKLKRMGHSIQTTSSKPATNPTRADGTHTPTGITSPGECGSGVPLQLTISL